MATREIKVHLPVLGTELSLKVVRISDKVKRRITRDIPVPAARGRVWKRDPAWRHELAEVSRLWCVAAMRYALADDTTIEWDKPLDPRKSMRQLAEETLAELREAMFDEIDMSALIVAVSDAAGLTTNGTKRLQEIMAGRS